MSRPKQNKEARDSAWRLIQYCELPDKNSRDNSRDIWIFFFLQYFGNSFYLFHDFSQNPG